MCAAHVHSLVYRLLRDGPYHLFPRRSQGKAQLRAVFEFGKVSEGGGFHELTHTGTCFGSILRVNEFISTVWHGKWTGTLTKNTRNCADRQGRHSDPMS